MNTGHLTTEINVDNCNSHVCTLHSLYLGFSGVLAKTVVAPIERVKLLLQTQAVNARISQTKTYSGGIACLKDLIEKEGVLALWRGNTANVIRYFPNQAFNFALKDKFRRFLGVSTSPGSEGKQNMQMAIVMWNNVIAGSAAGATTSVLTYPLDMARTRLATDISLSAVQGQGKGQRQFSGVWDCVRQSYVEGGLLRVYRGFPLSICGGKSNVFRSSILIVCYPCFHLYFVCSLSSCIIPRTLLWRI